MPRSSENKHRAGRPKRTYRAPKHGQIRRTRISVLDATIGLLGEVGYRRLTVDLISQRSGASRSTIYRHWSGLPDLVSEAFDRSLGPNPAVPNEGDIRAQLIALLEQLPRILERSIWGRILPSLIEAANEDENFRKRLYQLADARRDDIRNMIRRAIDRREVRGDADVEWMIDMLSSIYYHRRLITGQSLRDPELTTRTVDAVLASVRPTGDYP